LQSIKYVQQPVIIVRTLKGQPLKVVSDFNTSNWLRE